MRNEIMKTAIFLVLLCLVGMSYASSISPSQAQNYSSTVQRGSCWFVANLSQGVTFTVNGLHGVDNFIAPNTAEITFGSNTIDLYLNKAIYSYATSYYITLNAINWEPILVTANLTFCPGAPPTTSSTSSTSTSTTATTSATTLPTTIPSSVPSNAMASNSTQSPQSSDQVSTESDILLVAITMVVIGTIAAWLSRNARKVG
jgi:hypothetical protein